VRGRLFDFGLSGISVRRLLTDERKIEPPGTRGWAASSTRLLATQVRVRDRFAVSGCWLGLAEARASSWLASSRLASFQRVWVQPVWFSRWFQRVWFQRVLVSAGFHYLASFLSFSAGSGDFGFVSSGFVLVSFRADSAGGDSGARRLFRRFARRAASFLGHSAGTGNAVQTNQTLQRRDASPSERNEELPKYRNKPWVIGGTVEVGMDSSAYM